MTDVRDGGPAFPFNYDHKNLHEEGMTLRQHYAGQALIGLLASGLYENTKPTWIAEYTYDIADAMIAMGEAP